MQYSFYFPGVNRRDNDPHVCGRAMVPGGESGMVQGRPPNRRRRQRIRELRQKGLSLAEVGRKLGISKQAVESSRKYVRIASVRSVSCARCGEAIVSHGASPRAAGWALQRFQALAEGGVGRSCQALKTCGGAEEPLKVFVAARSNRLRGKRFDSSCL